MRKLMLAALLCLISLPVFAKGYIELANPVARHEPTSKTIEVTAVFSYTCGYCYSLEPNLERWQKTLPADVKVFRLPAAFNKTWEHFARAHYLMGVLKITDSAHWAFFQAIHEQNANLGSVKALKNFFASYGVEASQIDKLYSSFGIDSQVAKDTARLRAYEIDGVPALIINGKYLINGSTAGGLPQMLQVADEVIAKLRK